LIDGDDGLPAEEVGAWTKGKHNRLRRYLDISRATRRKFLNGQARSATFIDLFCGPGRARVKESGEWIDGSAVAAWKISLEGGAPFSDIYVADLDDERRGATVERLRRLNAPVRELPGSAVEAAQALLGVINRHGLHFAFLDPFSLGALDFRVLQSLARIRRVDMLLHVSAMDLQRNLEANLGAVSGPFDAFAPGWRASVDTKRSQLETRRQIVEYWRSLVSELGKSPSPRMELVTGNSNQPLYWLLLVAEHALAHKFWAVATDDGQGDLF
jgi:three-Cys-motif partner protein